MDNINTSNQEKKNFKKGTRIYLVVILIIASFTAGLFIGERHQFGQTSSITGFYGSNDYGKIKNKNSLPKYLTQDVDFDLFWQVWQTIQDNYIDKPAGETQLLYGSLMGMVASLGDPYSAFFEPQDAQEFQDELEGHFEGIVAEIGIKNNWLTVISPLPESPAEKAGLKPNDKILAINGIETIGIDLNEAVRKIRGEQGTPVALLISRLGVQEPFTISITRDVIEIVSVAWEIKNDNIAYIKVTNFHEDTSDRFKKCANEIILQKPKGIIVDLRSNPGGFLTQALDLTSYWVEDGQVVVVEKFSEKEQKVYKAGNNSIFKDVPTVILINQGSASGSEIMAGALHDYDIATLVGQTSFGKGSVQSFEQFQDGSALKLTIARWYTPNGQQIDEQGIAPDVEVELTEEDYNNGRDPQLDKAIELLTK